MNNQQITSASHLINYVALQAPNSEINVMVERDGKQQNFVVTVGERKTKILNHNLYRCLNSKDKKPRNEAFFLVLIKYETVLDADV